MKPPGLLIILPTISLFTFCHPNVKEGNQKKAEMPEEQNSQSRILPGSDTLMALPQLIQVNDLKQTDFSLTLENSISKNRNIIYAPAFLYAWEGVKKKLNHPILLSEENSQDFKLLNRSISYLNALNMEDYFSEVKTEGNAITVKASFFKSLPFTTEMEKLDDPILFNNKQVRAFGMYYFDEAIVKHVRILHYKDDENFVLRLLPKDKASEIILVKGLNNIPNLNAALIETNNLIKQGEKEQSASENAWKYQIIRGERLAIPSIKFNLETNYKTLERQIFKTSDGKEHYIETAYQRTGFVLNEKGAAMESEAVSTTDSIGAQPKIPYMKKLNFNKPYYLILKKVDQANPYFMMKISNTELLTEE